MTTTITWVSLADVDGTAPGGPVDVEFTDTIADIRPAGSQEPVGEVVDGAGRFLAPGLLDAHVHLSTEDGLTAAVRAGVTTVVDLGTHPDSRVDRLRAFSDGPAILSAGSAASAPGSTQIARMGFPDQSGVAGPDDAERFLDWRVENGSDLIKIIVEDPDATDVPALDISTITALVEGARRRSLLTVAHVVTASAFGRALDAGVDVLTHAPLDRPLPDETVQRMLDDGTVCSPTLVMMRTMARARLGDRADAAFENALTSVRRLLAAGVTVIAGTDANETPIAPVRQGEALHEEIGLLRDAGMTPADAVRAATTVPAGVFGLTDRGVVAVGLRADLLLVGGDPLVDPFPMMAPDGVWVAGDVVA